MGKEFSHAENVFVISVYTVASIARGYGVRRFFNWYHVRDSGYGINKIHDATEFNDAAARAHRMRTIATATGIELKDFEEDFETTKFTAAGVMKVATLENVTLESIKKNQKKVWNENTQRWDDNPAYSKQLELESQK